MGDEATQDRALMRFLARAGRRFRLDRAILFGSRARGDALLDSDVDLVLVSRDFADMSFNQRVTAMLDFWNARNDLEPICLTPEEFERKRRRVGIVREAVQKGIDLPVQPEES